MGLLSGLARLFLPDPPQVRDLGSFTVTLPEQVAGLRQRGGAHPWRAASIREALGVPAILRAVSLIANTTGMLSLRSFRNGVLMAEPPRLVQRPNPFSTPREFFRDTAYYLSTRGEAVWWIAARDIDNVPASLLVVPLQELTVEKNERDRRFPIYKWGNQTSTAYSGAAPGGEFVHITYLREPGELRGKGPLQICGAAISVTVEAQEWAANFFGGDPSQTELNSLVPIDENDANRLREQWIERGLTGLPRVTPPELNWKDHQIDPESAQMVEARSHQDGEAARMFGIPGSLLEYSAPGSSLTYQNVEGEYTKFVRTCLTPNYLEPIEQALSDLLTRSTVARFNVDGLLRADIKTRFEVHKTAIDSGIYGPDYAQRIEGIAPGDIEMAPIPFSPPTAVPANLPSSRSGPLELVQQPEPMVVMAEAFRSLASREQPVPTVTVHSAPITVEAPPPASIMFERGSIQVDAPPPAEVNVNPPNITVEAPQITFEQGAVQVDAPDLSPLGESFAAVAERPPPPMSIEMKHPDIGALADAVDKLEHRPVEVHVDSRDFAGALNDLKTELSRSKTIVRDDKGRIVGLK